MLGVEVSRVSQGCYASLFQRGDVLVSVPIAVLKHHAHKQLEEERAYFSLPPSGHTPSLGKVGPETQGRNLDPGTKAEAMEGKCLLI